MNFEARWAPLLVGAVLLGACRSSGRHRAPAPSSPPPAATAALVPTPIVARTPGVGSSPPPAPASTVVAQAGVPGLVTIAAGVARPATIAVQVGRAVTWLNADSVPHHVVSDEPRLFDTGEIGPGMSAAVTLSAPGIHDWHDTRAPNIKGTVRVLP